MLIEFKVSNFLSFEKEEIFDLSAGKGRNFNERVFQDNKSKILKFSALFGANGSGKSNFVKAIQFSRSYITRGNNRATIQKFYKLKPEYKETPSLFEYKIKLNNLTYTYGFKIILSKNEIINEWLLLNNKNNELIFEHDRANNIFNLGKYFKSGSLQEKLRLYSESLDSGNNSLFLSSISRYNNLFAEYEEAVILRNVYNWFSNKLKIKFPDRFITNYAYFMSEKNLDKVLNFFKDFDISISSYKFIQCSKEHIAMKLPKEIFDDFISTLEKDLLSNEDNEGNTAMFGLEDDFYIAKVLNEQIVFETIQFYHENTDVPFSISEESDGTKKILKLLEILFQDEEDIVYIVDEIDRCLHPLLTYNFVNAYLNKASQNNCQLVVTTHESLLLDFNLLRKDEVRLVSKMNGSSIIESIGDTQIRSDKKLVKEYLLGNKGVPNIKNNAFSN